MRVLALALLLCLSSLPARAAELVMFETEGCYWCLQWKTDIGSYYHQTREGRIAPLRLVDLHDPRPPHLRAVRGIAMTPTFVLMDRGREIGRIIGYPGERAFWAMLSRMLGGQQARRASLPGRRRKIRKPVFSMR